MKLLSVSLLLVFITFSSATMLSNFNTAFSCRHVNNDIMNAKIDLDSLNALSLLSQKHREYLQEGFTAVKESCSNKQSSFLSFKAPTLGKNLEEQLSLINKKFEDLSYKNKDQEELKDISEGIMKHFTDFASSIQNSSMSMSKDCNNVQLVGNKKIEEYKIAGERLHKLQMALIDRIYSMEEYRATCESRFV